MEDTALNLELKCTEVRENILTEIGELGVGHLGGSLSMVELLVTLYYKHMNVDPKNPQKVGRDRLIVSKGHSGPAVYAVLAEKGYFPKEWLLTLNKPGTNLPSHCDMNRTPGIDMTTGSLGQGFSCAVGIALASNLKKDGANIYTIIGDGESQEGQIWEAAMFASHHKLDNLIAFTDYNKLQLDDSIDNICSIEPLADKWKAFGWNVQEINGHDFNEILDALDQARATKGKPSVILAHTVKGKGVPFMENVVVWHGKTPSKEDYEKIPKSKIELLKKCSNPNYKFNYNPNLTLEEQNVSKRARAIIAILFRDYWATDIQRNKIVKMQKNEFSRLEMEKEKKYDVNNIFNNAKKNKENTTSDNEGIIIYKKSFFQRLKEKIKYIIKNKRKEK